MTIYNYVNKRTFSLYDALLGLSMTSNVFCLTHIQLQNNQIRKLVDENRSLVDSINKLNANVSRIGEEMLIMHSKSSPILINTSDNGFYGKTLLVVGVVAVGVGVTYYLSSAFITKLASISIPNLVTIPKFMSLGSMLNNLPLGQLPFIDQKKEMYVFLKELSTTIIIEMLNGEVSGIKFRPKDDEATTPIVEAIRVFLKSRRPIIDEEEERSPLFQTDIVDRVVDKTSKLVPPVEAEAAADTLNALTSIF